ncbi:MAG: acyl carrier protein [Bryobacteraceae bacterium]
MSGAGDRARALLAGALEMAPDALGADASIATLEAWDSLAHLRLVEALERAVGRPLEPEAIVAIGSLADVIAILEAARNTRR